MKRTPTALRILQGNPAKRPLPANEPKPKTGIPDPLTKLSDDAKRAWTRVSRKLVGMRVLTTADGVALEALCEAYADLVRARRDLDEHGWYQDVTTKSGDVMRRLNPAAGVMRDADRRLRAWLQEFGLTPSARAGVSANGESSKKDPLEDFVGK